MSTNTERRAVPRLAKDSRHRARETALQMLYQWEVGRTSMDDVLRTFRLHDPPEGAPADVDGFAVGLARGVAEGMGHIDPVITEAAEHWRLERMNVIDRLILRLAVYEFLNEPETPARIVINEALELARTFSGDDAVRFVNGVLDAIRRRLARE